MPFIGFLWALDDLLAISFQKHKVQERENQVNYSATHYYQLLQMLERMAVEGKVNVRLWNSLLISQVHDQPTPLCTMWTSPYPPRTFFSSCFKEQSCSFEPPEKEMCLQRGVEVWSVERSIREKEREQIKNFRSVRVWVKIPPFLCFNSCYCWLEINKLLPICLLHYWFHFCWLNAVLMMWVLLWGV